MQDRFTKELTVMLKNILEKIAQEDFDITSHIKNCVKTQYIRIILPSNFVNIIDENHYIRNCQDNFNVFRQKY